jgi:hypothetical protein
MPYKPLLLTAAFALVMAAPTWAQDLATNSNG